MTEKLALQCLYCWAVRYRNYMIWYFEPGSDWETAREATKNFFEIDMETPPSAQMVGEVMRRMEQP